jgi:hypothetical protein
MLNGLCLARHMLTIEDAVLFLAGFFHPERPMCSPCLRKAHVNNIEKVQVRWKLPDMEGPLKVPSAKAELIT